MKKEWGLVVILVVFFVGGCSQVKHHPQRKANVTKKSVEKTLDFTKGIPGQLQNTFYQYSTSDASYESDQLSELIIKSDEILLNDLTSDQETEELSDVSYRRLKKNTYVLYNGNLFRKIRLLDNQDLDNKYYVNSLDFRDYISFNTGVRNSYEAIVQSDGSLQFPRYFHTEVLIKNGKYVLKTLNLNDASTEYYVTFSKKSTTCLKDDATNQLYYLEKDPKQQALKKMGIEEPTSEYYQRPNNKIESKTYDFADDRDDDYYDTYDDFDLNEGD